MDITQNHSAEIERIRQEFERRKREIPENFYSLEHPGNLFVYTQRIRKVLDLLRRERQFPLKGKQILEIGCGVGNWLVDFAAWGAEPSRLCGIDLDPERVQSACRRLPGADLRRGDAAQLPWDNSSFDIVLQSTVFTSILSDPLKKTIASEMIRVLKPEGLILWYDFFYNNPKNPHVRGIRAPEIKALFPGYSIDFQKITLAPPLARILASKSWILCLFLEKLGFLNTHYLAVLRKQ